METFGGIPMGGAAVEWVSEKISGLGKSMVQGKKLSETELGVGRAFGGGAGEDAGPRSQHGRLSPVDDGHGFPVLQQRLGEKDCGAL